MSRNHVCPAIYAGLVGGAVCSFPQTAQALSLYGVDVTLPFADDAVLPFFAGCMAGAVTTGLVAIVAEVIGSRREQGEQVDLSANAASYDDANVRVVNDAPVERDVASTRQSPWVTARHVRPTDWEATGDIRVQSVVQDAVPEAREVPNHSYAQTKDYGKVAESYVQHESLANRMRARAAGVAQVLSERLESNAMDGLPVIPRADGSVGDVGTSWWDASLDHDSNALSDNDLSSIPAVDSELFSRMESANRAVLAADELASDIASPAPSYEGKHFATAADASARVASVHEDANHMSGAPFAAPAAARPEAPQGVPTPRASSIAERLSSIDASLFPEVKNASPNREDVWAKALEAMEENAKEDISQVAPFHDGVGGADSLDEPDGLEGNTSFIPFRMPAGHPEVVDTDSYVDYLINQEFSNNSSHAARSSSRDYLRVIEGGSRQHRHMARRMAE